MVENFLCMVDFLRLTPESKMAEDLSDPTSLKTLFDFT